MHSHTDKCNKAMDRRLRRRDVDMAARFEKMGLSLEGGKGGDSLEGVATFRYLGRPLDQTDDDWPAVRWNIMRAM